MRITDFAERIGTVEHRMDSIEQRLDASFALLSTQILQSRRETNDAILAMRTDLSRDVAGEIAALRIELSGDIAASRSEAAANIAALRSDVSADIAALRSEVSGDIAASRSDVSGEIAALRIELSGDIAALRSEWQDRFDRFETALVDGLAETRRFMKILYEDLLSRIALLGEAGPLRQ